MGTGISMSSVNKIKELADNGDYSLALDILDHQDLTKSLSPQFIRICGEVYYENKRYAEARAALVKAHSMAPMGNKIIFSMVRLYLSMGMFKHAEKYFEIYRFNQTARDAGTLRIEYLIAKAYRKPILHLYSILLSANELESNEIWDYEMLLLHVAMKNMDKLKAEGEVYRATYKNSSKAINLEPLFNGEVDVEAAIYCFPKEEILDTDPDQEETRAFEKQVLESDELRMHPKDPKIMIMVENDEPVPNSVKFKQMFVRSKEKKEERKERQEAEKEEKTGWFGKGRLSRREKNAIEDAIAENEENKTSKEQLLDEIMGNKQPNPVPDMVEIVDNTPETDKAVYNDDVDLLSEEAFHEGIDDFDLDEEEFESIVMVDADSILDSDVTNADEALKETESEEALEEEPETVAVEAVTEAEPETVAEDNAEEIELETVAVEAVTEEEPETVEEDNAEEIEPETVAVEAVTEAEPETVEEDNAEEIELETIAVEAVTEVESETEVISEDDYLDLLDNGEDAEFAEASETAEGLNEFEETVLISDMDEDFSEAFDSNETFDFDLAFQSLDDYKLDVEKDEIEDIIMIKEDEESDFEAETEDPEKEESSIMSEATLAEIPETEETSKKEETLRKEKVPETEEKLLENANLETDEIQQQEEISEADEIQQQEEISEADEIPQQEEISEVDEIPQQEEISEVDEIPQQNEISEVAEILQEEEVSEVKEILQEEESPEVEEAPQAEESPEIELPQDAVVSESKELPEKEPEGKRKLDFPVFKSNLFPDYNRDEPPVFNPESSVKKNIDVNEEKIQESLKKEEQLFNETDLLLARLGIEFGTNYTSGISIFHDDDISDSDVGENMKTDDNDISKTDETKNSFSLKKK